jgi:hypothetical protein
MLSYSGGDPIRFTSFPVISFYLPWRDQSWRLSSSQRDTALDRSGGHQPKGTSRPQGYGLKEPDRHLSTVVLEWE